MAVARLSQIFDNVDERSIDWCVVRRHGNTTSLHRMIAANECVEYRGMDRQGPRFWGLRYTWEHGLPEQLDFVCYLSWQCYLRRRYRLRIELFLQIKLLVVNDASQNKSGQRRLCLPMTEPARAVGFRVDFKCLLKVGFV